MFISVPDPATDAWTAGHPYMRAYTNGVAQPATLVVTKEKEIWFAHTVIPSKENGGGAVDRPLLGDVWQQVKVTRLEGGPAAVALRPPRKQTFFDSALGYVMVGGFLVLAGSAALLCKVFLSML